MTLVILYLFLLYINFRISLLISSESYAGNFTGIAWLYRSNWFHWLFSIKLIILISLIVSFDTIAHQIFQSSVKFLCLRCNSISVPQLLWLQAGPPPSPTSNFWLFFFAVTLKFVFFFYFNWNLDLFILCVLITLPLNTVFVISHKFG